MKKLILLSLILTNTIHIKAQTDNIQNQILNYKDTTSEIINKGRKLLLEEYLRNNTEKVKEIKDYLIERVQNENYLTLYPIEYWLILFSTKEYDKIQNSIEYFDSLIYKFYPGQIKPQQDLLLLKLREKSRNDRLILISQIQDSNLEVEAKEYLKLHLDFCLENNDNYEINQQTLNDQSDRFIENYPNSEYEDFIRKYIRYKFVTSNWGYGFEFFSGYGLGTGDISKYYSNNIPFGIAFDIYYKNFALYLRDYIGFSNTKEDINYSNGIWEKNSQARIYVPEASVGYLAFQNNFLQLSPFLGIGATGISATENDKEEEPDLEEVDIDFTTTYILGVSFDIKLKKSKTPIVSKVEDSFWFIRLRYSYNYTRFDKKYPDFSGNLHNITIGIGGIGRKIKRDF